MVSRGLRNSLIVILVCVVLPVIVFLVVMSQFPADPARYHFNALFEADRGFWSSDDDDTSAGHWAAVLEHRQSLVDLGALQEVVLPLRRMNVSSNGFNEVSDILKRNTADGPFAQFEWKEGNNSTPIGVRIWYKPGELSRWESDLAPYSPSP